MYTRTQLKRKVRQKIAREQSARKHYLIDNMAGMPTTDGLDELQADQLIGTEFYNSHISRNQPSPTEALEVAEARQLPESTRLFLPGEAFGRLLGEIREGHRTWWRKPAREHQPLNSRDAYPYVTVTRNNNGEYVASEVQWGKLQFALRICGYIEQHSGTAAAFERPVYQIHHLQTMYPTSPPEVDIADAESDSESYEGYESYEAEASDDETR